MTIIYLYKKRHNITGLLYLGKTIKNPKEYLGSGKDWLKHLKENGDNVTTEIIKECYSQDELSYWGRYYSQLWSIVKGQDDYGNKIWANRIPETGGGCLIGDENPSRRPEIKLKKKLHTLKPYYIHPMKNPVIKAKISGKNNGSKTKPESILKRKGNKHYTKRPDFSSKLKGDKNPFKNPKIKAKAKSKILELYGVDNVMKNPDIVKKVSGPAHYTKKPGYKSRIKGKFHYTKKSGYVSKISGNNHYTKSNDWKIKETNKNYDHTLYCWKNQYTREEIISTRQDIMKKYSNLKPVSIFNLIKGKLKSYKGWVIIK